MYIVDELITPMQKQLDEILNNVANKEAALKEAIEKQKNIEDQIKTFDSQYKKVYPLD